MREQSFHDFAKKVLKEFAREKFTNEHVQEVAGARAPTFEDVSEGRLRFVGGGNLIRSKNR